MSQSPSSSAPEFSRGHVFKRRLNTVRRDAFNAIKESLLQEIIKAVDRGAQECILKPTEMAAEYAAFDLSWRDVLNDKNVGKNWRNKYNIIMTAANHGNGDIFLRFDFYEGSKPEKYKRLDRRLFEHELRLGFYEKDEGSDSGSKTDSSDDDSDDDESDEEPLRDKKKRRIDEEEEKKEEEAVDPEEESSEEEEQLVHLCDVCGEAVTNGASQAHSACVKLL